MSVKKLQVIGHRGLPSLYPENTIPSFVAAAELGVDAIEFDVHPTRDGQLVLTHDDTLARCSNGHGRVCDMTLAELRELDFGSWKNPAFAGTRIPTLAEAIEAILAVRSDMFLLVELKEAGEEYSLMVLDYLRRRGVMSQVLVLSFHTRLMKLYRELEPSLPLQGFPDRYVKEPLPDAYDIINKTCIWTREITAEEVAFFHARGIAVDVCPVDNAAALDKVLPCGVDSITTNAADVILPILKERGLR
ncbi:MAG: glycerophosphodiester phosphodiesterase family protein [Lentisphaeria bacterium]|nr:glycerophosphodiester phosphodiesterase family protein [Lentisphaeria bacterium]